MHLLSVRIQWMTFMKILMATTQTDKKILISFDDMIADIMTNRKLQDIKELFITCNKPKYSLVFTTQSYFSVPKDARLNSTHYLVVKINNKRELQNIAINYSADIDHKDFVKIYRECSKKISFRTTDTTLPASDHLRFRKKCFTLIKTTETDQLKIIDSKINANQAQYDLDRLAAKISTYSSGDLRKYEYLSGEDLEYQV